MAKRKTLQERLEDHRFDKAVYLHKRSHINRNTRVHDRVVKILEHEYVYFTTLTLEDKYLTLDKKYLFRKVKEAFGSASLYIANEDYGSTNGRLHFHVLASFSSQLDYTKTNPIGQVWKYGAVDYQPIHTKNDEALSKYLTKLTSHAYKKTAKKIIFSRGFAK